MKHKQFWKGRGFYLALSEVIAGSALASYMAISGMLQKLGGPAASDTNITGEEEIIWQDGAPVEEKQENVPKPSVSSSASQSTSASAASSGAASQQSGEPAAMQTARTASFVWPMQGKTLQAFSGDTLVYNDTMKDWRTHNGIDLTGEEHAEVVAPGSGTVKAAVGDVQWGGVVEIEQDGLVMRLCGVNNIKVKQGDTVRAGDVLGELGSVPAESAATAHIHVEFLKDGAYVDPTGYFG